MRGQISLHNLLWGEFFTQDGDATFVTALIGLMLLLQGMGGSFFVTQFVNRNVFSQRMGGHTSLPHLFGNFFLRQHFCKVSTSWPGFALFWFAFLYKPFHVHNEVSQTVFG